MATGHLERKLTAIFAADMVAYSRLMEVDETGTIARQKVHRAELIDPEIDTHGGRIVKTTGDGMLVAFPSIVDAVKCASIIQRAMTEREAEIPEDRRIRYRIGINLGDIIIDGDDILGDSVNIAARLESLAEPGGICISGTAYENLKAKVDVGYVDMGDQRVKNIQRPVRAYRVLLDAVAAGTVVGEDRPSRPRWQLGALAALVVAVIAAGGLAWWQSRVVQVEPVSVARVEPPPPERAALPLPGKPSIAVLPFNNLSGDSFAEVFQLDAAENIITALSRITEMSVIARSSTLPYKDKTVDVQRVAEELGARYVVEGSVKRSGDQVRITARLIDARLSFPLWGKSYNRDLQDVSAVPDEITLNVLTALEEELVEGARKRILRGNAEIPEAYSLVRNGLTLFQGGTQEENAEARRMFEKAVELDPSYSIGWHLLGYTHSAFSRKGWREDRKQERARAEELARTALTNDLSAFGPYILLSTISLQKSRYNEAVAFAEKAVARAPNDAMTVAFLGQTLNFVGRVKEALPLFKRAIGLSPYTPPPILFFEGLGYHSLGKYEEAILEFRTNHVRNINVRVPIILLAITSADLGRMEEARVAVQVAIKWHSSASAKAFVNALDYQDRAKSEHALATLIELGLPE